ncbi:hypothetical protein DH2020_012362 [Rehmannia glutinosa]|uniref:Uncharacterized protein n=1 Tax=Rehmannia glutinosa TaxID=99300 RepID=A0ABR0WZ45_REHGL
MDPKVDEEKNNILCKLFDSKEVKKALFDRYPDKASSPDVVEEPKPVSGFALGFNTDGHHPHGYRHNCLEILCPWIFSLAVQLKDPLFYTASPAFFAAVKDVPTGSFNMPFTVMAARMVKWLDYGSIELFFEYFMGKQPLSAIRDLCDPYLNLFRNIIPPIFDTLGVSPFLAFAVLGTLGSISE